MKKYNAIDLFKFIAAVLVVTIHTNPLIGISPTANIFLTDVLARLAVPFFFMSAGFFLAKKLYDEDNDILIARYILRLLILYLIWSAIYFPLDIYKWRAQGYDMGYWLSYLQKLFFAGSYYTLWFFPALIFAVILAYFFYGRISNYILLPVCLGLYAIGALGQPYYDRLNLPEFIDGYYNIFLTTRNGLFFGFPFLCLGIWVRRLKRNIGKSRALLFFIISFTLLTIEVFLAHEGQESFSKETGMWFFAMPSAFFLFLFATRLKLHNSDIYGFLRKMSTLIYVSHGLFVILFSMVAAKFTGIHTLMEFFLVFTPSLLLSYIILSLSQIRGLGFLKLLYE